MKVTIEFDENMKTISMIEEESGMNAVYTAETRQDIIQAFNMFIHDATLYKEEPVYNEEGILEYKQLAFKF